VSALSGGGIAVIVALVSPTHLESWRWALVGLAALMAVTAIAQMILQSREDRDLVGKIAFLYAKHGGTAIVAVKETTIKPLAVESLAARKALDGELYRVVVSPKSAVWSMVKDIYRLQKPGYQPKIDTDVLMEMYLVNKTYKDKFIREIEVYVTVDGQEVLLERQSDLSAYEFGGSHFEYGVEDVGGKPLSNALPLHKMEFGLSLPLVSEQPREGWTRFLAKEINPDGVDSKTWKVTVIDSLGNRYPITQTSTGGTKGEIGIRKV
jgi:hypothetical protein